MNYQYIFVDLDNTLLDFEAAEEYSFFYTARQHGLEFGPEELACYQAINGPLWAMLERREITKDELVVQRFVRLFDQLGISGIDPAEYNDDYLANLALNTRTIDGAEELCRFLHRNATLVVATNGVSATQHRRIAASGLEQWLDRVVVSDDAGAEKPDPRYFDRAFAACGAAPADRERCIILGDSLSSDIRGGSDYGIDTCWFNPKGKALPEGAPRPTYVVEKLTDFIDIVTGRGGDDMEPIRAHLEPYFADEAHINCAECTLMAALDAFGLGEGIPREAGYMSAFGGGMGCGSICGALVGAQSALGRYEVSRLAEGETPVGSSCPGLRTRAARLAGLFEQEFGSVMCRDLRPVMAERYPDGCRELQRRTCDLLERVLKEEHVG